MYFSKFVAIAVLTFSGSALAAPTATDFDVADPIDIREVESDGTSFDVEARGVDVDVDIESHDTPWGVADESAVEAFEAREAEPHVEARGFGCGPTSSRYECNNHCISLKGGRTGGYCGGFLWHTCKCIFG